MFGGQATPNLPKLSKTLNNNRFFNSTKLAHACYITKILHPILINLVPWSLKEAPFLIFLALASEINIKNKPRYFSSILTFIDEKMEKNKENEKWRNRHFDRHSHINQEAPKSGALSSFFRTWVSACPII